ncbi:MAG: hypothetical protein NZM10_01740, partial [Fimbriimonadales bacterium]|nr:hypothetical protein [Fimbriimonadales bacterium]
MAMRGVDWLTVGGLVAFAAVFLFLRVDLRVAPAEDAAMLMRYALHLAQGHGIVWNIGEPPVDGATDFLFMALVAALIQRGISPEGATRLLNFVAHLATVFLVYWLGRRLVGAPMWSAALAAFYLAVSAAPLYVAT